MRLLTFNTWPAISRAVGAVRIDDRDAYMSDPYGVEAEIEW